MTAPTLTHDGRRQPYRPRTATNAAAIAAACRVEIGHREHCLLCGYLSESATPAGLAMLVEHHARTQHGGQR